jgi:REP element-mobilizing transposase RayT
MTDNVPIQRKNIRLRDYDFSSPGAYMVTICTIKRHQPILGSLQNGLIKLSPLGKVISKRWSTIPEHFPGVSLDTWIIMPDHIHGILLFELSDTGEACLAPTTQPTSDKLPTLGAVIGSFKATVTRDVRKRGISNETIWQRGYYEHVLRNQVDLESAREYITQNPHRLEEEY